jgi:hypothetical protein
MARSKCLQMVFALVLLAAALSAPVFAQQEQDKEKDKLLIRSDVAGAAVLQQKYFIDAGKLHTRLEKIDIANAKTEKEVKDLHGEGPSNQWINLGNMIDFVNIEQFGLEPHALCPYSLIVYPDIKRETGIFYYFPQRFFIGRDEEKYLVGFDYKPESSGKNNVLIQARLTPGFKYGSLRILEEMVKAFLRKEGRYSVEPTLLPLPATFTPSFNLRPFGIPDDNISLPGIERVTGELGIVIETDVDGRQIFIDQMSNPMGIIGDVVLKPQPISSASDTLSAEIPVRASLLFCDKEAYSSAPWRREAGAEYTTFVNTLVFPVRLTHLVYLRPHARGVEVRGYNLGNQVLQPGDIAKIPNTKITPEIDETQTIAAWLRYTIDCDQQVVDELVSSLTGGVGAVPVVSVEINVLGADKVFDQLGVEKLMVAVRSAYFDPEGKDTITNTYTLTKSAVNMKLPNLYLWDEAERPQNRILYEYMIGVVMKDGTRLRDADWRKADELFISSIDIGESQITEIISAEQDN